MLNKESQAHEYTLHDSIYMAFWKRQNYVDRKQMSACQGLGEELNTKEHKGILESDGTVVTDQSSEVIKLHFKGVNFIIYEFTSINLTFTTNQGFCLSETASRKVGKHGDM